MFVLPACLCTTCIPSAHKIQNRAREGTGALRTGVIETDGHELLCKCWELDLGPLQKQWDLLPAESFLQPSTRVISSSSGRHPDQLQYLDCLGESLGP